MKISEERVTISLKTMTGIASVILATFTGLLFLVYSMGKDNGNISVYKDNIDLKDKNRETNDLVDRLNDSIGLLNIKNTDLQKEIDSIVNYSKEDKNFNTIVFYNALKESVDLQLISASNSNNFPRKRTIASEDFYYSKQKLDNYLYTLKIGDSVIKENQLIRFYSPGQHKTIGIR